MKHSSLVIAAVVAAGCHGGPTGTTVVDQDRPETDGTAAQAAVVAAPSADAWTDLVRPDLGFSASFPAPPEYSTASHEDELGQWVNHAFRAVDPDGASWAYQVTVKDYSQYRTEGVAVDDMLETSCAVISQAQPNLRLEQMEGLEGAAPGRSCLFSSEAGDRVALRALWSPPMFYMALATCNASACTESQSRFEQYFRSFQLQAPPAAPAP